MKRNTHLPVLESSRLRLRQLKKADTQDLFAIFADVQSMRYWSHPPFTEIEQADAYLRKIDAGRINGTHLQWGITLSDDDKVIGTTTLFSLNPQHRRAEIGYILASTYWKQGIGLEALSLVLSHVFDTLGYLRIEADIDPRNLASCRLVQKLGFRHEGTLRERWCVDDELQDSALHGLLARDFVASR